MNGFGIDKIQLIFPPDAIRLRNGFNRNEGWSQRPRCMEHEELGLYPVERQYFSDAKLGTGNATMVLENETCEPRLSLLFNPTTCLHDFALTTDMKKVHEVMQDVIYKAGIDADILEGNCKRIDVTKDRIMSEKADNYVSPLASFLSFRRQSTHLEYANGCTLGSQSKQLGFYNRYAKLEKDGLLNNSIFHKNTARLEYRLMSKGKRTWTKSYNLHTFNDVVTASMDQFNDIFIDGLRNVGLKDKLNGEELDVDAIRPMSLIASMQEYKEYCTLNPKGSRNWFQTFLKHRGIVSVVEQYSLDTLVNALVEVGGGVKNSNLARSRIKKDLNDAIKLNTKLTQGRSSLDYIHEFYEQFRQAV